MCCAANTEMNNDSISELVMYNESLAYCYTRLFECRLFTSSSEYTDEFAQFYKQSFQFLWKK